MVSLEMKDMIRTCHPPTPFVGLYRQSCCPVKTKQAYDKARVERDIACFPSMLHKMVSSFKAFRAVKRLWIQAIHTILSKGLFCHYLTGYTLEFLTLKKDYSLGPYLMYSHHFMNYEVRTLHQRFVQMSGRLVSLGYSGLKTLPYIKEIEHEIFLSLCPAKRHPEISALYHVLKQKQVKEKWRIVLSHLNRYKILYPFEQYDLPYSLDDDLWETYCNRKMVELYLDICLKLNGLSATEIVLLYDWFSYMKYPLY